MKPMLARTKGPRYDLYPCAVQPKLNGIRALYQRGVFQSRDERVWRPGVLGHITEQLATISHILGDIVLDGELYVHGWRLQDINSAVSVNRNEPTKETPFVQFHVFDTVFYDVNFRSRFEPVRALLERVDLPHVRPVTTFYDCDISTVETAFDLFTAHGYEGIMLRPADGFYETGRTDHNTERRSRSLWKYKHWEDGEFLCVGTTGGTGKASIGIGAFVCQTSDGSRTFNVGTGLTDKDRIYYAKHSPVGFFIKIRYLELTADGVPFNPSLLAVLD